MCDSVTDNFLAAARKFPRPRLAARAGALAFAPAFSSLPHIEIKKHRQLPMLFNFADGVRFELTAPLRRRQFSRLFH